MTESSKNQIVDPNTGDTDRAEAIIAELQQLLKKHNCVLKHTERGTVIAKILDLGTMKARAIAEVHSISPRKLNWRPVEWWPLHARKQ